MSDSLLALPQPIVNLDTGSVSQTSVASTHIDISCSSATRVRNHDLFMLFALWMEKHPEDPPSAFFHSDGLTPATGTPHSVTSVQQNNHGVSPNASPMFGASTSGVGRATGSGIVVPAMRMGAVLVDSFGRVAAIERTGHSHAAVRCLMSASADIKGCDLYLSRFPCSLCMKVAVQAGVRKIYYFPAEKWELAATDEMRGAHESIDLFHLREYERAEKNRKSVMRLVSNNSIALTLFIPQWDHGDIDDDPPFIPTPSSPLLSSSTSPSPSKKPKTRRAQVTPRAPEFQWPLDPNLSQSPGIARRFPVIQQKFARTCMALNAIARRYHVRAQTMEEWTVQIMGGVEGGSSFDKDKTIVDLGVEDVRAGLPSWARHAMVLAHIAAKRTDDPKLGVGSVFVDEEGRYFSVGWNGYPKKSQHLDYPQAGADDSVEYEELKYDYILHSEQNALLWRNPPGVRVKDSWVVVTKLPCDECSPMLFDNGLRNCITIPQMPKSADDPARLRGLTYNRVSGLMAKVLLFEV